MNPPRLVAVVGLLLVLLAFVGRILSNPEVEEPGAPTAPKGGDIAFLVAQVPPIGEFDGEFNVNPENPFVPVNERREEKEAITAPKVALAPKNLPKPSKPVVVEAPKLNLPKAAPVALTLPECLGVIRHARSQRQVLVARMPGGAEQHLERGARIGEWELIDLSPAAARFRDDKGGEHDVSFLPPTPTVLPEPEPVVIPAEPTPADAPPADPGMAPRPEGSMRDRSPGGRVPPRPQPAPDMMPKPPVK